jgi:hypothetical protein
MITEEVHEFFHILSRCDDLRRVQKTSGKSFTLVDVLRTSGQFLGVHLDERYKQDRRAS